MFPLCATIFFYVTELKSGDDTSYLYSLNIGRDRTEYTVVRNKPLSLDLLYQIRITKLLYAL